MSEDPSQGGGGVEESGAVMPRVGTELDYDDGSQAYRGKPPPKLPLRRENYGLPERGRKGVLLLPSLADFIQARKEAADWSGDVFGKAGEPNTGIWGNVADCAPTPRSLLERETAKMASMGTVRAKGKTDRSLRGARKVAAHYPGSGRDAAYKFRSY